MLRDGHKANLARGAIEASADLFPDCFPFFSSTASRSNSAFTTTSWPRLTALSRQRKCATAMFVYCGNGGYLRACKVGAQRNDLNGEVAGHVTTVPGLALCACFKGIPAQMAPGRSTFLT